MINYDNDNNDNNDSNHKNSNNNNNTGDEKVMDISDRFQHISGAQSHII